MNRRQSREVAFSLLFEWSFQEETPLGTLIEQAMSGRELDVDDFARELAGKTLDARADIDGLIERYSEKWKLSRLSKVTLAALRMAVCEMTVLRDIPVGATINEAVELVKKYATEDEASYVNGVLGQIGRDRTGADGK